MRAWILAAALTSGTFNFTLENGVSVSVDTVLTDDQAKDRSRDILTKVFADLCRTGRKTCAAGSYYRVNITVALDFCQVMVYGQLAETERASASPYWEQADYTCHFSDAHPDVYLVHANMVM